MSVPAPEELPRARVWAVLALALAAISAAGVLARLAEGVHPLAIAFWRTLAVGLLLLPWARTRPSARDALGSVGAGLLLAAHFWAWFASLQQTSVLRSTVLVCLTPIWVGVLEARLLSAPPPPRFWAGIAVAVLGVGLMVSEGEGAGGWGGDALALVGGMLSAAYFTVGRSVRQRLDFLTYGALVCLAAALWLAVLAGVVGAPLVGLPPGAWVPLLAMALGPQLLGHVGLNFAVRYLPAARVASLILLEPVGAAVLAAIWLRETPSAVELAGAGVVLAGVGWAALRRGSG